MIKLLKIELRRAFIGKAFIISLSIGCLIAILQIFKCVLPMIEFLDFSFMHEIYPHSVFNKWMGGESYSLYSSIFYMILPLLASLPFADSFYTDMSSGYVKNVFIRTNKKNYLTAKYISVFVSAGVVIIIPLLLNLFISSLILPSVIPDASTGLFSLFPNQMWSEIYYSNPYLYIFMYIIIDFIFAGLFACLALVISYYVINRFIVMLSPFAIYISIYSILGSIKGLSTLSPYSPLNPNNSVINYRFPIILLIMIIFFIISFGGFMIKGHKNETY